MVASAVADGGALEGVAAVMEGAAAPNPQTPRRNGTLRHDLPEGLLEAAAAAVDLGGGAGRPVLWRSTRSLFRAEFARSATEHSNVEDLANPLAQHLRRRHWEEVQSLTNEEGLPASYAPAEVEPGSRTASSLACQLLLLEASRQWAAKFSSPQLYSSLVRVS